MAMIEASLKERGRCAGFFWLLTTIATAFSLGYARSKFMVAGDAAATAANITGQETLFRSAMAANILAHVFLLLFGLALYRLFREFDRDWSRVLLASVVVSIAISMVNVLNNMGALWVLGAQEYLNAFTQQQRQAMAVLFLRFNGFGQGLLEVLWTPFYFAFGWMVIRSGYLPKILGILLIPMSLSFSLNVFMKILAPTFYPATFTQIAMLSGAIAGLPTMFYLLVKGARETKPTV